jgi:ribosomal protein L11 methylase PrmA
MREAGVQDGDIVIKEGEGWGEGRHPSTYMCLQFVWDEVSTRVKSGATPQVFDYGCGSGVLAIAARRFGAGRVVGVDKDEAILEHAVQNAVLNFGEECEGDENVGHGSENEDGLQFLNGREVMPTASGLLIGDRWEAETFDVVVANMLPAVLIKLAPAIALALTPNSAALALCGMRRDQVAEVRAAYERLGVVFEGERGREGAAPGAKWAEYVQLIGRSAPAPMTDLRAPLSDHTGAGCPSMPPDPPRGPRRVCRRPAPSAEQKRALLEYLSDAAVG